MRPASEEYLGSGAQALGQLWGYLGHCMEPHTMMTAYFPADHQCGGSFLTSGPLFPGQGPVPAPVEGTAPQKGPASRGEEAPPWVEWACSLLGWMLLGAECSCVP